MRFKSQAASLDASLSFLSTSRRCSQNRSPSRLFAISVSYAVDDIGGGLREVISNLDVSLGSDISQVLHRERALLKVPGCR